MEYVGTIYRPPSEANSLIIQATIGCSHNKCTFCSMYKDKEFRLRTFEELHNDLVNARKIHKHVKRIFLADGDAFAMPMSRLSKLLKSIGDLFPECERVGSYATPHSILNKSLSELRQLKKLGLGILYLGIESGSNQVLKLVEKGTTSEEMIEAGQRVKSGGMKLSAMIISGLGGHGLTSEHALASAEVVNAMNPDYLSLLTLMVEPGTPLFEDVLKGTLRLLSVSEIMEETHLFIKNLNLEGCLFRTNHASNYLAIGGKLPEDKKELLDVIEQAIIQKMPFRLPSQRAL